MGGVMKRLPVETADDLATLDISEIVQGYQDGRANEPEPGDNRSRAYWHGWRVGMMDGGHMDIDAAHRRLVHAVAPGGKVRSQLMGASV